jgi:hypothetical protein
MSDEAVSSTVSTCDVAVPFSILRLLVTVSPETLLDNKSAREEASSLQTMVLLFGGY